MKRSIILKSVIVGLVSLIVGLVTTRILIDNKFPNLDYKTLMLMLFNYFIQSVILHAIFEFSGLNDKFCEYI